MIPGYSLTMPIDVRWRDVDAFGHVNNAVYFTYFEMGRTFYFEKVFKAYDLEKIDFIVVSAHCDYLSQVSRTDTLELGVRVPRVGTTSFDFEYELRSTKDGRLVAKGWTTQVLYDYKAQAKKPITPDWLAQVALVEGKEPERRNSR